MNENAKAHTGEHILFQALSRIYKGIRVQKISFKEERRCLFCKYDGEITWEGVAEAELIANRIIWEDRKVSRIFGTREEVERMFPHVRAKWERIKDERICVVEVEGFDVAACSGDHVNTTREIGFLFVRRFTKKNDVYEIEFEVDEKAKIAALQHATLARRLAILAGTSMEKTYETFLNIKERNTFLEKRLQGISTEIMKNISFEITNNITFYKGNLPGVDRKIIADKAGDLIRGKGCTVLFASREEEKTFYVLAHSSDIDFDASFLLSNVLSRHEGRGGGRHEFAQGSAREEAYEELLSEVKRSIEKLK